MKPQMSSLRPASGWFVFALLAIFSAAGAWFFQNTFFFLLLILLAGAAIFSTAVMILAPDRITAAVELSAGQAAAGAGVSFSVLFFSAFRFAGFTARFRIHLRNDFTGAEFSAQTGVWIGPGHRADTQSVYIRKEPGFLAEKRKGAASGRSFCRTLTSARAGHLEAAVDSCRIYDLFHLFSRELTGIVPAAVLVLPHRTKTAADDVFQTVENLPAAEELKGTGIEIEPDADVREYIPGDELKTIHWKLSAKRDALMVRERERAGGRRMNLLLPLTEDVQNNDDLAAALLYLGRGFLERGFPLGIYYLSSGGALVERSCMETSDFEAVFEEILSMDGRHPAGVCEETFLQEHPGVSYIRVEAGEIRGAYIKKEKE